MFVATYETSSHIIWSAMLHDVYHGLVCYYVLINRRRESWPRSPIQTERSEVWTNFAGSCLKYPIRTQCHFVYERGWKNWTKKVELIGRYLFNFSRLFQWLTKFPPRIQIALSLVFSVFWCLLLQKFLNFDFIFARSFFGRTSISQRLFVFSTCFLVKEYWFFLLVSWPGTSQFFHVLCL